MVFMNYNYFCVESCMKQDIYVCTFCQVFSPLLSTVVDHISTLHLESLPSGTKPKDFVSKLQSLHGNMTFFFPP